MKIVTVYISKQKFEVNKHLNRLNKPAVKNIHSPNGDIIDCVPIEKQPDFHHPFLKDHKIQMKPNYHPEGLFDDNKMSTKSKEKETHIPQLCHRYGKCSEGTIPMRMTKEDDILRAISIKRYCKKKHRTVSLPKSAEPDLINQSGHQHAIVYVEGDKYYGAKATINVWEPKKPQQNEFSLSHICLLGGSFRQDLNSIEAGWQIRHCSMQANNMEEHIKLEEKRKPEPKGMKVKMVGLVNWFSGR